MEALVRVPPASDGEMPTSRLDEPHAGPASWMSSRLVRLALTTVVFGGVGFLVARYRASHRDHGPPWPGAVEAHVPHLQGMITLDGDADDPGWQGPSMRTGAFVGTDGLSPVHPYSEARILWGNGFLYLNLYAADEDIRALGKTPDSLAPDEDAFHLVFTDRTTERILDINALGVVTDGIRARGESTPPDRSWTSEAHVSHELDGTPNKPGDNDEEWVLEVAIPFESLGLSGRAGERIGLSMDRCDTPHGGKRVCGSWGETGQRRILVLDAP